MADERRVWVAAVLSLICTGLGHIYCGRLRRGLVFFFVSFAVLPIACLAALFGPAGGFLIAMVAAVIAGPLIWIVALVDSVVLAATGSPPRAYSRPLVYVLYFVVCAVFPVALMLLTRAHVLEAFKIPTRSMAPTIDSGDRILVNKLYYAFSDAKRWDVVVFRSPENPEVKHIKRIVGLPGDRVELRDGRLILNGEEVPLREEEDRGEEPPRDPWEEVGLEGDRPVPHRIFLSTEGGTDLAETTVPEGSYFMLGDNRPNSLDSRRYGPVPREDVIGPVWYLFWPGTGWDFSRPRDWSRFGAIPGASR